MTYKNLPNDKKKELNNILEELNAFLRDNSLYFDSSDIPLYSVKYGYLALIEDTRTNLILLEDDNDYIELYTTQEQ